MYGGSPNSLEVNHFLTCDFGSSSHATWLLDTFYKWLTVFLTVLDFYVIMFFFLIITFIQFLYLLCGMTNHYILPSAY